MKKANLRDHMTHLELIFSMLGEAATPEIARKLDARGLTGNKIAAQKGGRISGGAQEKLGAETGEIVVTPRNDFIDPEKRIRLDILM